MSKKSESEGLKRRPSLNKQMRKKFESIIGANKDKNKLCDDVDLIDRVRSLPTQLKGTIFNIKVLIYEIYDMIFANFLRTKSKKSVIFIFQLIDRRNIVKIFEISFIQTSRSSQFFYICQQFRPNCHLKKSFLGLQLLSS